MTLIEDLLNLFESGGDGGWEGDYYECRRCGSALAQEDDACASCGSEDIAAFVF